VNASAGSGGVSGRGGAPAWRTGRGLDVKRIFVYFAGIGDVVMLVPFLRRLATDGPLDLLVRDFCGALFATQPFVRKVWTLRHPNRGRNAVGSLLAGERRRLGTRLRVEAYDEVVDTTAERAVVLDWIREWSPGVPVRLIDLPRGLVDRPLAACESLGMGMQGVEACPRLEVDAALRTRMAALLRPLGRVVGVQVGSGPVSKWPRRFDVKGLSPEQWTGVAGGILRRGDADALVFQGSPSERSLVAPIAKRLSREWPDRIHDWTGRFTLGELLGLMSGYRALVSVDTGPAHMAAAIGCPLLVFFGPSDPKEYLMRGAGPVEKVVGSISCQFCAGTERFKRCVDNRCLRELSVEALLDGWARLVRADPRDGA